MRWYARPENEAIQLRHTPRPASWNAKNHPDQRRLRAYLDDTKDLLIGSEIDGPWALRLDVAAHPDRALLTAVADLDNYAYPLAHHLMDPGLVSVWCTKRHDKSEQSFIRIQSASGVAAPSTELFVARTTASFDKPEFKGQVRAAVEHADALPPGPVKLELSFAVGPGRKGPGRTNWHELWKPTIDALDPLLGLTYPDRRYHPLDGRIVELGMHLTVVPSLGRDTIVGVAATAFTGQTVDDLGKLIAPERRPKHRWGMRSESFGLMVTCPRCGAAPQVSCTTFNNHIERWEAFNESRDLGFNFEPDSQPDDALAAAHGEWPPSENLASIRQEIERVLVNNPRTRYAKVLIGMRRGRSDATMAKEFFAEEGKRISSESVGEVRRLVALTLEGKLVSARSDAAAQARIYRELLNHQPISPELDEHISAKLAELRKLDPDIPSTPLC